MLALPNAGTSYPIDVPTSDPAFEISALRAMQEPNEGRMIYPVIESQQVSTISYGWITPHQMKDVMRDVEALEREFREGLILRVPKRYMRSYEVETAFRALSHVFQPDRPVTEIIREDRGPLLP